MSRLEELIQTLCPDGVEHRELAELADIGTGNSNRVDAIDDGKYPFFVRSKQVMRSNKYDFDEEAIVIPGEGGIGEIFHYIRGKYDLHQRAYRISFRDSRVNTRFAYYFMRSNFKKFITMKAVTATVISIRMPMIASFLLPIPPLPIQEEIVRVLDTFSGVVTELEQSLEAEQAARVRQYEHYRDSLLFFEDGVNRKRLGEIGNFYGGLTGKTKNDFQNGNHKFITYMNVYKNPAVDTRINDYVKINTNERQNTVQYGDILFTGSSETPEECGISSVMVKHPDEPFYLNSFTIGFRLHDSGMLNPEFSKHLFRSSDLRKQINKTANGVTRFNVSKAKLSEVIVPIPTLIAQEKIVSILDRFDTLVNDLKSGLPAEIALRRKQYEYYRDKLLTFQPLE